MNGGWRCVTHALQEIGVLLSLGFPLPGAWQQWARRSPPPTSCSLRCLYALGQGQVSGPPTPLSWGESPLQGVRPALRNLPFLRSQGKGKSRFCEAWSLYNWKSFFKKKNNYDTMWDLKITIYVKQEKKSQPISNLKNADQYHKHHKVHTNDKRFQ